ncbi:hypothetical protein Tco_1532347 [Tanacetum coccineum]
MRWSLQVLVPTLLRTIKAHWKLVNYTSTLALKSFLLHVNMAYLILAGTGSIMWAGTYVVVPTIGVIRWGNVDIGVIVCGPPTLYTCVAKECRGSFIGFIVENICVVIMDGASRAVDLSELAMSYNIREDLSLIAFLDVLLLAMLSRSIKPSCQAFKVTGIVTSAPGFRRRADFNASHPMEITQFYDEICTSIGTVPALATLIQRSRISPSYNITTPSPSTMYETNNGRDGTTVIFGTIVVSAFHYEM